jgi:hypothetical protein
MGTIAVPAESGIAVVTQDTITGRIVLERKIRIEDITAACEPNRFSMLVPTAVDVV